MQQQMCAATWTFARSWCPVFLILIPHEENVDVIIPINVLFRGDGEFWSLMKIKLMLPYFPNQHIVLLCHSHESGRTLRLRTKCVIRTIGTYHFCWYICSWPWAREPPEASRVLQPDSVRCGRRGAILGRSDDGLTIGYCQPRINTESPQAV